MQILARTAAKAASGWKLGRHNAVFVAGGGGCRSQRKRKTNWRAGILPAARPGQHHLLLESTISAPNKSYRLRTLSDVTGVFVARDRQLARFCVAWRRGALGVCALAIVLLTKRMTRPRWTSCTAPRGALRGDYSARAEVATQDEIGSVAESFNAMAAAVQKKWMRAGRRAPA